MKRFLRHCFAALVISASGVNATFAQTTITSGGASFVRPAASAFDTSPTANFTGAGTGDYVFETGWWFRVSGDTQESFFPTPTSIAVAPATVSTLTWTDVNTRGLFDATEVATISSAAAGTGTVRMDMTITNRSAAASLTIDLFHFIDLDVNGSAGTDSVTQPTPGVTLLRVTDATAGFAEHHGVAANNFMVRPFAAATDVAGLLSDTLVTNFDNSGVPATGFDMTGGMQWSLVIPPSGSRTVTVYFTGNVAAPVALPTADLSITKTDGLTSVTAGGSTTYTITASNAGPDAANGATVADTFPASLTCNWTCVGAGGGTCTAAGSGNINDTVNLPAGGSVTYTASCSISGSASGSLANTATVSVPGGITDPTSGNNSATDTDTIALSADLSITKTDGVTSVTAGGSTTYTIVASNAGPSGATGATVADTFPASLTCTWTCVGAGGGTCTAAGSGNINDTVNLPAGGSVTYTASCSISGSASGSLANTATVTEPGGTTDPTLGNNSATDTDTVGASSDLSITKTDGVASVTAGGSTTYTIVASNAGPSGAAGATVADTFPASLTCTWTCVGAGGGTCTAAGSGNINDTVNLPSGGSVTYTANCSVSSAASGSLANTATVTAPGGTTDPTPGNNSATDTDIIDAVPLTSVPASGATINLPAQTLGGASTTSNVVFTNPGGVAASVSCSITAGATQFAVNSPINVPASGGTGTATIAYNSASVGTFPGTLTCTFGPQTFTFTLSGTTNATPLTSTPSTGSTVTLPPQGLGGPASTSVVSFNNPGLVAASVTCSITAGNTQFSVNSPINVAAGGSGAATISYSSSVLGNFAGTLDCVAGAQNFSFTLNGSTIQTGPVPLFQDQSRWLLILLSLSFIAMMGWSTRRQA